MSQDLLRDPSRDSRRFIVIPGLVSSTCARVMSEKLELVHRYLSQNGFEKAAKRYPLSRGGAKSRKKTFFFIFPAVRVAHMISVVSDV
eukprot:459004-Amorphochlora_amoeboformis.AAC.1